MVEFIADFTFKSVKYLTTIGLQLTNFFCPTNIYYLCKLYVDYKYPKTDFTESKCDTARERKLVK